MKKVALFLLLLSATAAYADRGLVGAMGVCVDGAPRTFDVVNGNSASDCSSGGGGYDVHCCCLNGAWAACASAGGGSGTVTSAAMSVPTGFTISGSPITTSGTFTLGLSTQSANTVWSGPTSGGAATPAFRALVDNDVPDSITVTLATAASDLTCTNCIGGTEIDESALGAVPTATALAANGSNCAAGKSARGVDASGAAESCDDTAPYALKDPLMPPASAGTGGCIETFAGGAEVCTWAWGNQDSAAISYNQGGASLIGDTTNELHVRGIAAATNADQTFTVRLNTWYDGSSSTNDSCGAVAVTGGTLAAPTEVRETVQGDFATDGFYWVVDTDYNPAAGATTHTTLSWDLTALRSVYTCHQLRYIDSSRELTMWYSTGPECTDFTQLGIPVTMAADPTHFGFYVRREGPCRVQRAQLRTDTDRNVWGAP